MPMSFPDMTSLARYAKRRGVRRPLAGETQDEYREMLATRIQGTDAVEAGELRSGKPWDEWGPDERAGLVASMVGADPLRSGNPVVSKVLAERRMAKAGAFVKGRQDYNEGVVVGDNPYGEDTDEFWQWMAGWTEAGMEDITRIERRAR